MPWVRFDDQFPIHRKVGALPGNAPGDAVKATASNPLNGRRERLWLSPARIRDDLFAHLEGRP